MSEILVSDDPMLDPDVIAGALPDATIRTEPLPDERAIVAAGSDAAALVVDVNTPVPASVFEQLPALQIVARAGVGFENVDVKAAAEHDVVVTNVPEYCTDEVATHGLALLLDCVRKIAEYDRATAAGGWAWEEGRPVHRFPDTTLGLVSFGPIARRLRERVRGFDLDVIAYDPYVDSEEMAEAGVEQVSFEELLARADHVSLHAPLTDETEGLIDADALGAMQDHAIVVNTARGGLIDEAALADALADGEIGAAGLDVSRREPPADDSPLRALDNCLLTPHAGWYSVEAREELNETVARNVAAALDGETPPNRIDPDLDWL
ncbi:C-terminal binding protein [Halomicrobium sp. IBSBa]|uniref:C-terminal binding protein n=1 Tax=Halomicrobium sp. IBSBa TaxID=2778916 RepID=UPI001ABF2168|nr:C-terminal binding protein [Halomicrobium sp. IBSBa]MBO4247204.1 C-terminal binding protein [Halomicrobium sp. IBSBa]